MKTVRFFLQRHRLRNAGTRGMASVSIPECSHTPSVYKGTDYETIVNFKRSRASPNLKPLYKKPLLINEGRGQWLWDHEGKRYLDMFGGIATVSVGHCHPKVTNAIVEQSKRLGHVSAMYLTTNQHDYIEKLTSKLPEELNVAYLVNSGSEATELAMLIARLYTGSNEILSLRNCYHGATVAASNATAMNIWKYPVTPMPGHIHIKNPDVYKGPWGGPQCRDSPVSVGVKRCNCPENNCEACDKYFDEFQDVIKHSLPKSGKIAAFIAESIQGVGGTVQFPRNYLKRVYEAIQGAGGLCIADEVQTGFGRTGQHFWGFQGNDIKPDIVTMAKGIGNGFPLGAVVTTTQIAEVLDKAMYYNTYGGNPLACAAGSAVLDVIDEEKLQSNSLTVGTHLLHRLSTLMLEFPNVIGDVRGKGLMIGIELVSDPVTKDPLPAQQTLEILEDMRESGVLMGKGGLAGNVLRIKPPMCISKEDADFTIEVMKQALQNHRDKHLTDKEFVYVTTP